MFSCFKTARLGYPSAVLMLGEPPGRLTVLHVIPEDGQTESQSTSSPKNCFGKAKERTREHMGTVTLDNAGGSDTPYQFMDDLQARVKQLRDKAFESEGSEYGAEDVDFVVEEVLRPGAIGALRAREGRTPVANASSSYPLYLVYIDRPAPGDIMQRRLTCIA